MYVLNNLLQYPGSYANKCNLDSRNDAAFKNDPCKDSMLDMLNKELLTTTEPHLRKASRNISCILDSSDEEEDIAPKPKRKQNKRD